MTAAPSPGIEHYTFARTNQSLTANDLFDPASAEFYGVANRHKTGDLSSLLSSPE
jgi:hypothetical protein